MSVLQTQLLRAPASWRQRLLRLLPWHRRLALLASVGVLSWALSGMLHPLMTALQPQPASPLPPQTPLPLEGLLAPRDVLQAADITQVQALRLIVLEGEPWYQVRLPWQLTPRYWNARSGAAADLSGRHAEQLAAHFLGSTEALKAGITLNQFGAEYAYINRLLPVVQVNTARDDGLRVYVDLFQDRLGTLVDDRKSLFSSAFLNLHSFAWLDGTGNFRPLLMLLLLGAVLLTVLMGISLFVARRQARTILRRLHGIGGVGLAILSLGFASSACWHVLHKHTAQPAPAGFTSTLDVSALTTAPNGSWLEAHETLQRISLLQLDGKPIWRLQGKRAGEQPTLRYVDAKGQPLDEFAPQRYAEQRFAYYARQLGLGIPQAITLQTQFDHEYGFVMKRLPVLKAQYTDTQRTSLYIDPLDGALSAHITQPDRLEGFSFAYLHKWAFLNDWSKTGKDVLLSLAALAHLLLVAGGLWLYRQRRR